MSTSSGIPPKDEPQLADALASAGSGAEDREAHLQEVSQPAPTVLVDSVSATTQATAQAATTAPTTPRIPPLEEQAVKRSPLVKIVVLAVVCVLVLGLSIGGLVSALGSEGQAVSSREQQSSGTGHTQSSGAAANSRTAQESSGLEDTNSEEQSSAASSTTSTSTSTSTSAEQSGSNTSSQPSSPAAQTINVSLSVSCYDAVAVGNATAIARSDNGAMLYATLSLNAGTTVYDALMASGINVGSTTGPMGVYVVSIRELAEKDAGAESGWKYYVNGIEASITSSNYVLKEGDSVEWRYVLQR